MDNTPAVPDVRFFTRDACSLCVTALGAVERELARRLGPPRLAIAPFSCGPTSVVRRVEYRDGSVLQVIDVDREPDLKESHGFRVPVVEVLGGRTLELDFDPRAFAEALSQAGEVPLP